MYPSHYLARINDASNEIQRALGMIALDNIAISQKASQQLDVLANDFDTIKFTIEAIAPRLEEQGQRLNSDIMAALKQQKEEILAAIAESEGINGGADALRDQLSTAEMEAIMLNKSQAEQDQLAAAIQLSRLACVTREDETCPEDYMCPVSLEIMSDPVILVQSGVTYERAMIEECLFRRPGVDPLSGATFEEDARLIPNYALKGTIESWLKNAVARE